MNHCLSWYYWWEILWSIVFHRSCCSLILMFCRNSQTKFLSILLLLPCIYVSVLVENGRHQKDRKFPFIIIKHDLLLLHFSLFQMPPCYSFLRTRNRTFVISMPLFAFLYTATHSRWSTELRFLSLAMMSSCYSVLCARNRTFVIYMPLFAFLLYRYALTLK